MLAMGTISVLYGLIVWLATSALVSPTSVTTFTGNWCIHVGAVIKTGDFDGDGYDDLICYDAAGKYWVRYAHVFKQDEFLDAMSGWCTQSGGKVFVADFNGDTRDDLLCHDKTGTFSIALADNAGKFSGNSWTKALAWCYHASGQLHVGDFNGDGRSDILCHDTSNGYKWISLCAPGTFFEHHTSWQSGMNWCSHVGSELHVGDFNGDQKDDILCHDRDGKKWIASAQMVGTTFSRFYQEYFHAMGWCSEVGAVLRPVYLNDDLLVDLICYDKAGSIWTAINYPKLRFSTPFPPSLSFCPGDVARVLTGNFRERNKEQLLCATDPEWKIMSDFV